MNIPLFLTLNLFVFNKVNSSTTNKVAYTHSQDKKIPEKSHSMTVNNWQVSSLICMQNLSLCLTQIRQRDRETQRMDFGLQSYDLSPERKPGQLCMETRAMLRQQVLSLCPKEL